MELNVTVPVDVWDGLSVGAFGSDGFISAGLYQVLSVGWWRPCLLWIRRLVTLPKLKRLSYDVDLQKYSASPCRMCAVPDELELVRLMKSVMETPEVKREDIEMLQGDMASTRAADVAQTSPIDGYFE